MSVTFDAVQSAAMARRATETTDGTTDQVNLRIPKAVKAKLAEYNRRLPLRPTMTAIMLAALDDWFARNPLPPDAGAAAADAKGDAKAARGRR